MTFENLCTVPRIHKQQLTQVGSRRHRKDARNNPPPRCRDADRAAHIQEQNKNKKSAPQCFYCIKALQRARLRMCACGPLVQSTLGALCLSVSLCSVRDGTEVPARALCFFVCAARAGGSGCHPEARIFFLKEILKSQCSAKLLYKKASCEYF